ncbi:MAG: hypothetical protein EHM48_03630, partial [Planctomycetaceae bacterium]
TRRSCREHLVRACRWRLARVLLLLLRLLLLLLLLLRLLLLLLLFLRFLRPEGSAAFSRGLSPRKVAQKSSPQMGRWKLPVHKQQQQKQNDRSNKKHGRDARATHGQDAHATYKAQAAIPLPSPRRRSA